MSGAGTFVIESINTKHRGFTTSLGVPFEKAMIINTVSMACMLLLVPFFGRCSDFFGRKGILFISTAGLLFFSLPLYWLLVHGTYRSIIFGQIAFAVLASGFNGAITSAVLEMFPTHVRYGASAIGYNLSCSLLGGTIPIVAIYLINRLHSLVAPSLYLVGGAIIALVCVIKMKETYLIELQ